MVNLTGKEPVYMLQKYLRTLHYETNGAIPCVFPDGIYGNETIEAVKKFQKLNNLPETGRIDYGTWKLIYGSYTESNGKKVRPKPLYLFPEEADYTICEGENSDIVAIIQFIIRALANMYECIEGNPPSGVYDKQTAADIMRFQKLCGLRETGKVDRNTWNRLTDSYNRLQKMNK